MALNPSKISFLFERIRQSDSRTFRSTVAQLFTYLSKEIKDNPVYDKYETEKQNWGNWLQGNLQHRGHWKFPDDFDKAKSLSYYIYKRIAENDERSSDSFINSLFTNK